MTSPLPQPDKKVQPIRCIPQREAHEAQAKAGGVDDLVEFRAFYTRDVLLFGAVAGPEDGEPVVMLHGFPDMWLGWARQIRPLVEAGYRLIIPDLRGYNRSEKPGGVAAYQLPELGQDVVDLLDAVGLESAHLVGHDWGGAIAWWLAEHHAERWKTATILNCPHADVLANELRFRNPRQMVRSWYIALFQIPHLSEAVVRAAEFKFLEAALRMGHEDAFTDDEIEAYRDAWSQDGAVRAMLNYYRAARRAMFSDAHEASKEIAVPTTIIWGVDDKALDRSTVEPSAARCRDAEIVWVEEASHWVQRDCPELVSERLREGFQG